MKWSLALALAGTLVARTAAAEPMCRVIDLKFQPAKGPAAE